MKVIRIVICAFMACGLVASAASIEQVLDIFVSGAYQGEPTFSGAVEHDKVQIFRINSPNIVRALAIDYDTNFYTGTLLYKTSLDGNTTNVVIRQRGRTNELDVTTNFTFKPVILTNSLGETIKPSVVDQVSNITTTVTTSRVETMLMALSFTSSSVKFSCDPTYGTVTRTHSAIAGRVDGTPVSGYANLLSFAGGGGIAAINTNLYSAKTNVFADTNLVGGVVKIQFNTHGPAFSPN